MLQETKEQIAFYREENRLFGSTDHVCVHDCLLMRVNDHEPVFICKLTGNVHVCVIGTCEHRICTAEGYMTCNLTGISDPAQLFHNDAAALPITIARTDGDGEMYIASNSLNPTLPFYSDSYNNGNVSLVDNDSHEPALWGANKRIKEHIAFVVQTLLYSQRRIDLFMQVTEGVRQELDKVIETEKNKYIKMQRTRPLRCFGNVHTIFAIKNRILRKHKFFTLIPDDNERIGKYVHILFVLMEVLNEVRHKSTRNCTKQWNDTTIILNLIYFIQDGFIYKNMTVLRRDDFLQEHLPLPDTLDAFGFDTQKISTDWFKNFRTMLLTYFESDPQKLSFLIARLDESDV